MIVLLISLFLTISNELFSQTSSDLIGNWNVINVNFSSGNNSNPDIQKKIAYLKNAFTKSKFHFKDGNVFYFDCPIKELEVKNGKWNYDEFNKKISITGKAPTGDEGNLMAFKIRIEKSKFYFIIDESPLLLEVQKD